jgi:hypothetical protein
MASISSIETTNTSCWFDLFVVLTLSFPDLKAFQLTPLVKLMMRNNAKLSGALFSVRLSFLLFLFLELMLRRHVHWWCTLISYKEAIGSSSLCIQSILFWR